jgi:hypothetical protein
MPRVKVKVFIGDRIAPITLKLPSTTTVAELRRITGNQCSKLLNGAERVLLTKTEDASCVLLDANAIGDYTDGGLILKLRVDSELVVQEPVQAGEHVAGPLASTPTGPTIARTTPTIGESPAVPAKTPQERADRLRGQLQEATDADGAKLREELAKAEPDLEMAGIRDDLQRTTPRIPHFERLEQLAELSTTLADVEAPPPQRMFRVKVRLLIGDKTTPTNLPQPLQWYSTTTVAELKKAVVTYCKKLLGGAEQVRLTKQEDASVVLLDDINRLGDYLDGATILTVRADPQVVVQEPAHGGEHIACPLTNTPPGPTIAPTTPIIGKSPAAPAETPQERVDRPPQERADRLRGQLREATDADAPKLCVELAKAELDCETADICDDLQKTQRIPNFVFDRRASAKMQSLNERLEQLAELTIALADLEDKAQEASVRTSAAQAEIVTLCANSTFAQDPAAQAQVQELLATSKKELLTTQAPTTFAKEYLSKRDAMRSARDERQQKVVSLENVIACLSKSLTERSPESAKDEVRQLQQQLDEVVRTSGYESPQSLPVARKLDLPVQGPAARVLEVVREPDVTPVPSRVTCEEVQPAETPLAPGPVPQPCKVCCLWKLDLLAVLTSPRAFYGGVARRAACPTVVLLRWLQILAFDLMDNILGFLKNTREPTDGNRFLGWVSQLRTVLKQLLLYNEARAFLDRLTSDDLSRKELILNAMSVKKILRPIDFECLGDLLQRNARRAHAFAGSDIAVLLGSAGVGKSTTVGYLGGVFYKPAVGEVGLHRVMVPVDPDVRSCRLTLLPARAHTRGGLIVAGHRLFVCLPFCVRHRASRLCSEPSRRRRE